MRIALCDDNLLQLEIAGNTVNDILRQKGRSDEVVSFSSGRDLLKDVKENGRFDIYILDMIMPEMNGMEVACTLRLLKDRGQILFLSASLEYAARSYDVDAAYYFLKPIEPVKFGNVLERLISRVDSARRYVTVQTADGDIDVAVQRVLYTTIDNRRPRYQLRDGRILYGTVLRGKFRDAVRQLLDDRNFAQCGSNYVINLNGIRVMDRDSIVLENGEILHPPHDATTQLYKEWLNRHNRV